jgi:glycosyltransferase involved in cell wall biosynthesis
LQKHFQIKLDIVGDGDKLNSLLDVTKSLGLENNVTFHGNCRHDEVLKLLSNNHIFVFPTNTKEGFPKALLEAMACGLPSIATRVSVIPFLIENKCGIVIDHTNPNAIADAVLVMTSIKDEMREMGQRARKISKEYTLENWRDIIGARLEQIWGPLN